MLLNKKTVFALATMLVSCIRAQDAAAPKDSAVVSLTGETFDEFINEHPLVLAEFFAPWCGHCKHLAPEFIQAAERLKENNISLAQIDCTENEELCEKHSIRGYPMLKIFQGDSEVSTDYMGDRKSSAIVSYMLKQMEPTVKVLEDAESLAEILEEAQTSVIVDGGVEGLNETFYEVANKLRNEYDFIQYPQKDAKLSVYLPGEKQPINYQDKNFTTDAVLEWVNVETMPYFGEIDASTFRKYMTGSVPLAYYFYNTKEEREDFEPFFIELGKKYRGKLNIAGLNALQFGRHAEALNMKQQFPLFVIHDLESNLRYGMPQLSDEEFEKDPTVVLDKKEVEEFVVGFFAGSLEPIIKSEEIPEEQETNVYKLVGKTHLEIVNDASKDVLVKYYAPWCSYCKKLAPTFEELADLYAEDPDAKDKVLVADMDVTLNDFSGVEIEGFPTLVIYPAQEGAKPIYYSGDRSLESFLTFVQEEGAHKIDGLAILEQKTASEEAEKTQADVVDDGKDTESENAEEIELDEL